MQLRFFSPAFLSAALLIALCSSAFAEEFSFSDTHPVLRIAYTAGTKGELYPCPT